MLFVVTWATSEHKILRVRNERKHTRFISAYTGEPYQYFVLNDRQVREIICYWLAGGYKNIELKLNSATTGNLYDFNL